MRPSFKNEYVDICDNGKLSHVELRITSPQGKIFVVLIDAADKERVSQYRWQAYRNGKYPLVKTSLPKGASLQLCRLLLNLTNRSKVVDYKDRNRLNMRQDNLRAADYSDNALNRRFAVDNTTGRVGIYLWHQLRKGFPPYPVWSGIGVKNGRKFQKSFSVAKYGFDEAKRLATEFRKKFEEEFGVLSPPEGK
jgi:hypothetical protein